MNQPTPGELARRDQINAHNNVCVTQLVARLRGLLEGRQPRWQVESELHRQLHLAGPDQVHALAMAAVMALVDQAARR